MDGPKISCNVLQVSSEFYKQRPSEEKIPAKDLTGNTECKTEVDK